MLNELSCSSNGPTVLYKNDAISTERTRHITIQYFTIHIELIHILGAISPTLTVSLISLFVGSFTFNILVLIVSWDTTRTYNFSVDGIIFVIRISSILFNPHCIDAYLASKK